MLPVVVLRLLAHQQHHTQHQAHHQLLSLTQIMTLTGHGYLVVMVVIQ
jgi:hypothetical protein